MTTTRPIGLPGAAPVAAQPGSRAATAAAPVDPRNSRRLSFRIALVRLLRGEVRGDRVDLLVGIAPGELLHHRGRAPARSELLHQARDHGAVSTGETRD